MRGKGDGRGAAAAAGLALLLVAVRQGAWKVVQLMRLVVLAAARWEPKM